MKAYGWGLVVAGVIGTVSHYGFGFPLPGIFGGLVFMGISMVTFGKR